jgi:hypothetical protein
MNKNILSLLALGCIFTASFVMFIVTFFTSSWAWNILFFISSTVSIVAFALQFEEIVEKEED